MTALEILRSFLEARRETSSREISKILTEHGYSLATIRYVIKQAKLLGWIAPKARNRRGVWVYKSLLYEKKEVE